MENLKAVLSNIVAQRIEQAQNVLHSFNIFVEATPVALFLAANAYGSPFTDALFNAVGSNFVAFDGSTIGGYPETKKRKNFWDKLWNTTTEGLETAATLGTIIEAYKQGPQPVIDEGYEISTTIKTSEQPEPKTKIAGLSKPIFYGGMATVLLVVLYLVIGKK